MNRVKRRIIEIDEEKCTGCGQCIPECPEGAIQVIDGKARIISDLFCDGLGACVGSCPYGALKITERLSEPYDERKVMENIISKGDNTIRAHLKHLHDHGEKEYLKQALEVLKERKIDIFFDENSESKCCADTGNLLNQEKSEEMNKDEKSWLNQWPIQLRLVNPNADCFRKSDIVIAADCTGYAYGNFHSRILGEKPLIIACPKLDHDKEAYIEKIRLLVDEAMVSTITVVIMEVPCCSGLIRIVEQGVSQSERKIPVRKVVIGINGNFLNEELVH
ncbi:MAG: 4Fe-4S binding protein [Candidatus Omnitrophica bacterium]|nr:4Fe-4S binding protein [Candidatus Omnitrophota bacterium]